MIYLDNAATTVPSKAALDAFSYEAQNGANPSSAHRAGYLAHVRLEEARAAIAQTLFCEPEEITFTSGGTESANLAIFGVAEAMRKRGNIILCSDAEHPCVSEPLRALAANGFEVRKVPTKGGVLHLDTLLSLCDERVILACFMRANNETGALFDLAAASRIVRRNCPQAKIFCDCVQSYLHEKITPFSLGADLLSLSAHKVRGIRGTGALYHKKGLRLPARTLGGGQESALRSGTENTPGIAAFAAAAKKGFATLDARVARINALRETLATALALLPNTAVLNAPHRICHIVSAAFAGQKSEVLLRRLSDEEIYASAGSACSAHGGARSSILLAHGLSPEKADSTLRFSLGDTTTQEDIDKLVQTLKTLL